MLPARVVHVHPTRVCNLACAHCYSTSSPRSSPALDAADLRAMLRVLREEGYEVLSVSGGEPLVYRGLDRLASDAVELGYRVHVVTNGLLLTTKRLAELRSCVHLFAVSFDGAEQTHNEVRGRADAFRKANRSLDVLADAGMPFGIAFGVTTRSLPEVPWAYDRAREVGAQLLHLRPLVPEGRAREMADDWYLSHEDQERLYVLGELLDAGPSDLPHVQVDLVRADALEQAIEQFPLLGDGKCLTLSDAVNPLVINELGKLLPFTYGIDPRYTISDLTGPWQHDVRQWVESGSPNIAALLRASFESAARNRSLYLDWFAHLTSVSRDLAAESFSTAHPPTRYAARLTDPAEPHAVPESR